MIWVWMIFSFGDWALLDGLRLDGLIRGNGR
jgi:hypothetical protein